MDILFIIVIIIGIIAYLLYAQKQREAKAEEAAAREREREKRQRDEGCGEIVRYFANTFGDLARQAVSRAELSNMIDSGISPEQLAVEIATRMERQPGITIGYHPIEGNDGLTVKIPPETRDRHVYIIGKSGSGKTNLLRNMILQDMDEGHGVGVIAPEQEMLTEELLPYIPTHRIDDVIYVNPADTERPVPFNPLHMDDQDDIDLLVDENMTIFRRVMDASASGPRMDEILRQSLYALLPRSNTTLLDIERLLIREDPTFRNEVIRTSKDPEVSHFFRDVYPTFPKDAHLPITNRLGRLTRPRPLRALLCSTGTSLNIREAIDTGKILLFNLSDGIIGEANSQLLGQFLVSKFQTAVMSRADTGAENRRRFHLYIDEFQTFTGGASASYEKILSRARKYRLALTLAHQQTGQLPQSVLKEIFGNVSTMLAFNVARSDAQTLAGEFQAEIDGKVEKLAPEELLTLRVGEAWCKIGRSVLFARTYPAPDEPNQEYAERVIEHARQRYGISATRSARQEKIHHEKASNDTDASHTPDPLDDIDPGKPF